MAKQCNIDVSHLCPDENEDKYSDDEEEERDVLKDKKLNNLAQPPEHYPDDTSCWQSTIESLRNFCKRKATIRVFYFLLAVVFIAPSIALICLFVPMSNDNQKISAHLEQTSLLVEDCRQNSYFLRGQNEELQHKLETCEADVIKIKQALDDKTKHLEIAISQGRSRQQQIWDLNAKIMALNNEIGHLGQTQAQQYPNGWGWLSFFSTGSSVVPSKTVFAATGILLLLNIIVR